MHLRATELACLSVGYLFWYNFGSLPLLIKAAKTIAIGHVFLAGALHVATPYAVGYLQGRVGIGAFQESWKEGLPRIGLHVVAWAISSYVISIYLLPISDIAIPLSLGVLAIRIPCELLSLINKSSDLLPDGYIKPVN